MREKITSFGLALACSIACLCAVVLAQKGDARRADRLAVVEAERAFARAAAEKGTREAFLEFLADDGVIFQPGPVNGKRFWRERPPRKGLLSWEPVYADVSRAGDMGYTTGPWEFRPGGADDKPVAFGQYFTIWRRQADGTWKVALDRGTSNPQPTSTAAPLRFPDDTRGAFKSQALDAAAGRALMLKLEAELARAASAGGIERAFRRYLADDARLFRENSFPAVGKHPALAALASRRGTLTWQPTFADLSRSADLGYTYGTYQFRTESAADKPERGNYVRVWKREAAERWRVVIDILNPLPPA